MINEIKEYIIIIISVIIGFIWAYFKGKSSGKQKEQFNQMKANNEKSKRIRKARKINTSSELDDKLQDGTY